MANFVHLHVHSEYSLLDGLSKTKNLVSRVKELGMSAVALTDHGNMYGAIEFYKHAKAEGIKPIIGMEGYVSIGDHRQKDTKQDRENHHLVLLAKDHQGYKNLMKISSIAHTEGFYYRPRFSKEVLEKYHQGLICLSACPAGEIGELLIGNKFDQAKETAGWFANLMGTGNYYLEIQRHNFGDYINSASEVKIKSKLIELDNSEKIWIDGIIKISRELGIPLVATNDAHYIYQKDAAAQDVLVCISTGKTVKEIDRMRYVDAPTFYLTSTEEMSALFPQYPDALENTLKVSEETNIQIELGKWHFPNYEIPEDFSAPDYLRKLTTDRLKNKYQSLTPEITKRMDFELDVIIQKGYASYFLMMSDMVNWCTQNNIITNTRGSAAGSIVSYVLGITTVDPIRYALPFERFLNPLRPKPPDIDLDIADDRREELIAYIRNEYGEDKVAQICTFGRMLARASVRDVGRALGHPYSYPDKIAKLIPMGSQGFPMSLKRALDESVELKSLYDNDPQARELLLLAQEIEGNARHASVHAAGLVVSPTVMTDFTPLQLEPKGIKIITQYEMHAAEEVGLVKFDILGIRNLSILGAAKNLIESNRHLKIDLENLPINDKNTYQMLAHGDTMGVFQLAGSGMTKWLKELKPNRIEDIMVMIALFRPGPMANIPEFIARKNKKNEVTYLHPKMKNFLEKSYGILVYQEDILFTAIELAGYDWNTVDALRQAIGKKKPKEMAQQHDIFVQGCQKVSGMTKDEAENIWGLFVPFQGYGFNKAHAASYGIVSYQTAFLKANYPVEYMTALMTAESGNTEKIVEAINECKRTKILILAPDINSSQTQFTIEPNPKSLDSWAIRFGFSAIKNVGEAAITSILTARKDGLFKSLTDFCNRVDNQKVNRKVLESLIKTGTLDCFGKRSSLLSALDQIRQSGASLNKLKSLGQFSLFLEDREEDKTDHLPDLDEIEEAIKLGYEKELLGFYLTDHPHAKKLQEIKARTNLTISDLYNENYSGKTVSVGGVLESVRVVTTRTNNQQMCFAKLSDLFKSVELVVFPKTYALTTSIWQPDAVVFLTGKVEGKIDTDVFEDDLESEKEFTILVDSAKVYLDSSTELSNISSISSPPAHPKTISIYIPKGTPQRKLVELNTLLQAHKGTFPAELVFTQNGSSRVIPLPFGLNSTPDLTSQIANLLNNTPIS